YRDAEQTQTGYSYDSCLRVSGVDTFRSGSSFPESSLDTYQRLLEDTGITYDSADNPKCITDGRDPDEWPAGAKPVDRTIAYDDFYRATSVTSAYHGGSGGNDSWTSPYAAENAASPSTPDPRQSSPSGQLVFSNRPTLQTYAYDWIGNTTATNDDA